MMILTYDYSFEGFLSAVFEVYALKLTNVRIRKKEEGCTTLFETPVHVSPDELKTNRVLYKLKQLLGEAGIVQLWKAWLTEEPDVEDCLLGTIQYAIEQNANVLSDFGHLQVLQLQQQLKKIGREKHRMEAFVRFQLTKDQLFFATVEPDFNVLPLLIKHFQERYADQRWLIFDLRRRYGIYYNLHSTEFVTMEETNDRLFQVPDRSLLEESELLYQTLWKDYFKSTNIASRKNTKLHLQHVPRRYWKYLIEKGVDLNR
jgi:probable DNA metabolism protein